MSIIIDRLNKIKLNISKTKDTNSIKIVAVSKTFSLKHIMPLIEHGHEHFGENKVQEADVKWHEISMMINKYFSIIGVSWKSSRRKAKYLSVRMNQITSSFECFCQKILTHN